MFGEYIFKMTVLFIYSSCVHSFYVFFFVCYLVERQIIHKNCVGVCECILRLWTLHWFDFINANKSSIRVLENSKYYGRCSVICFFIRLLDHLMHKAHVRSQPISNEREEEKTRVSQTIIRKNANVFNETQSIRSVFMEMVLLLSNRFLSVSVSSTFFSVVVVVVVYLFPYKTRQVRQVFFSDSIWIHVKIFTI